MKKISDFICRHRWAIVILSVLLLIPAALGYFATKVNYDLLVYLPSDIETLEGQEILTEEFGMGAFSVAVVEDMPQKELLQLEAEIREVESVKQVLSIADVTGTAIPIDFLPSAVREKVTHDGAQLMIITFTEGTSDERTLAAVEEIREIAGEKCLLGGMSAMVLDTKNLFNNETLLYVTIAVGLSLLVLVLFLDSFLVPFLLIGSIGVALAFNMGTNILLGEISYITQAISAVLQLGVTMDFSIFLYHKYEAAKKNKKDRLKAMSQAIQETAASVVGSSLTTFAGFLALCTMSLTLGFDIGIVMAKGVLLGLVCAITLFPALLLVCDKWVEKTRHKALLPEFTHVKSFVLKYRKAILAGFLILLVPAYVIYNKVEVYYKLDSSIPEDYGYTQAMTALREDFGMESQMMVLARNTTSAANLKAMSSEIAKLDGVSEVLDSTTLSDYGLSAEMLNSEVRSMLETENYSAMLVLSDYGIATDELNEQISKMNEIVDKYDEGAIVAGEGPLMKDLVEIADRDFASVNITSIAVIFVIMAIVLKSVSLPVLLMAAIEFAIFLNMGVSFLTGTEIPFIASIVIGTIQLGATIDYAILLTTKYMEERKAGLAKKEAAQAALDGSIQSIFVSGMCFFAATIGVGLFSQIDMIGTLCTLIARGAIISMVVVVLVIPALLVACDKLIMKTTLGTKVATEKVAAAKPAKVVKAKK
jgi:hypothetical protein